MTTYGMFHTKPIKASIAIGISIAVVVFGIYAFSSYYFEDFGSNPARGDPPLFSGQPASKGGGHPE